VRPPLAGTETIAATITITIATTITITTRDHEQARNECALILHKSMGSGQRIPLVILSQRSVLPEIQLSTFSAESKAAIVHIVIVRHREILSQRARILKTWHLIIHLHFKHSHVLLLSSDYTFIVLNRGGC